MRIVTFLESSIPLDAGRNKITFQNLIGNPSFLRPYVQNGEYRKNSHLISDSLRPKSDSWTQKRAKSKKYLLKKSIFIVYTSEEASFMLGREMGEKNNSLIKRREFLKLAMEEREKILREQAEKLADYYEKEVEWKELGGELAES